MSMGLWVQYLVVGLLVLASLLYALRKLAPQLTSRWLATASIRLNQPQRAGWVRALGRRLQPAQASGHCGDGCDTCGSCGPKPPASANQAMPLEFRPRRR